MKKLIFILSLCISSFVTANESSGSAAAKAWLKIVDSGNYTESWQKSDSFFNPNYLKANGIQHLKVSVLHWVK
ncbi:DUF4019 domain-containing protein [Alteromonas sp. 5E99-2]|uniref:DUF4019 domain-containing protein n=1 Tax=Alteromonas sp. 5E99-2 TaxID=2817683 RepID=UPI001F5FF86E|nr:DUF4019 domain-containing protein [Alteromonas sp. 5E99-2]